MDNTYVKLYRKATENDIMRDPNAWLVFSWILLKVDRRTGKWKTGRIKLARLTGLKPATIYKVLKRIQNKYQVASINSNSQYSEISVSKWAKYQPDKEMVAGPVHKPLRSGNTLQELRNKNINITNNSTHNNAILQDEDFKKAIIRKEQGKPFNGLLETLDHKYPLWKYGREWSEARKVLFS